MTPDEIIFLQTWAHRLLRNFAMLTTTTFLHGIYLVLTIAAVCVLWRRNAKSTRILYAMMFFIFVVTTIVFALELVTFHALITGNFIDNPDLDIQDRFELSSNGVTNYNTVIAWTTNPNGVQFIFGDAIIVWRVWMVWQGRKVYVLPAIVLLLACIVMSIASGVLVTLQNYLSLSESAYNGIDRNIDNLLDSGLALSIACNLYATGMVGYMAYKHRRLMNNALGTSSTRTTRILVLLAESGVIYSIFQIVYCVLGVAGNKSPSFIFALVMWTTIAGYVSAIYPSLLILVLSFNRSIINQDDISGLTFVPGRDVESGCDAELPFPKPGTRIHFARSADSSQDVLESRKPSSHGGGSAAGSGYEMGQIEEYSSADVTSNIHDRTDFTTLSETGSITESVSDGGGRSQSREAGEEPS